MNKQKQNQPIECEIRGPITWSDFCELRSLIEEELGKLKQERELVIFIKDQDKDLRLKVTSLDCFFVFKKTIDRKTGSKIEKEIKIPHMQLKNILATLSNLGYKRGFLSFSNNYEAKKGPFSITFKFGTKIGDFFEIEEMVNSKKEVNRAFKTILKIAKKFDLLVWDNQTYERVKEKGWKNEISKPLLIDDEILPAVSLFLKEIKKGEKNKHNLSTINNILLKKDNDYSFMEEIFYFLTEEKLVSWKPLGSSLTFSKRVSVIIPSFNSAKSLFLTLKSLASQNLSVEERRLLEVIIVDDGSFDETERVVKNFHPNFKLKYIKQNNLGRGAARNLGVSISKGEILIFIDADVILEKNFIKEHAIRQSFLEKIILVSFKENIKEGDYRLATRNFWLKLPMPDITKDFRFKKEVKKEWLRMHRHVRGVEVRTVEIIKETNNFKSFGKNRVIGAWDLPAMVITNAVSMRKKEFEEIGGFNLQFKGWGMEDTFLGSCLIGRGNFIVPCFSTGIYHIEHGPRSGSKEKMIKEFQRNVLVYLDLINKPIKEVYKNDLVK